MLLSANFWPWWLGALALALVGFGYFVALGIPCGVSGVFGRVLNWRSQAAAREVEIKMSANPGAMQQQMMAEALAALKDLPEAERAEVEAELRAQQAEACAPAGAAAARVRPHPAAHLLFLLSIVAGGFLAAALSGTWSLSSGMGETYAAFFGHGATAWLVMFAGGICVGVGTMMAGGCTMGHGISGNANLQLGSFVSTAAFFGTAVLVSVLLQVML
jgi:uncharacterized membrane protein YedE/YeeE